MSKYILKTLGCKANLYDSQLLEDELQKKGLLPHETRASDPGEAGEVSLCIINSCTVTNEADRQTRKLAEKMARENPGAKIVVTGCAAEVDPEGLSQAKGVHFVVGNQNKDELVDLVLNQLDPSPDLAAPNRDLNANIGSHILKHENFGVLGTAKKYKGTSSNHAFDREWPAVADSFKTPPIHLKGYSDKTRSFLKIQEGCNSFCTYCIIPYGRGPSRSLRPRLLLDQVRALVGQGIREIVITGTNIGDYGTDWNTQPVLDDLLEMILEETKLERLRVSSLDPTEITPKMISLMESNPRFCPHFHVSLQSPHSKILRLMKRRYGFEEVKACLEKLAGISAPVGGVYVGMDVITGFPGESEEDFEWGYQALSELPWTRLHVFPYSEREGTPATKLPKSVPQSIRVDRTRKLNQLSMQRLNQHYRKVLETCSSQLTSLHSILMEKVGEGKNGWTQGFTPNYLRIMIPSQETTVERNQLVSAQPMDLMLDSKGNDVALVCKLIE